MDYNYKMIPSITYKKLFHLLIDRNMKPSDLNKLAGISWPTISQLEKDNPVRTDTIARICQVLRCEPGDIMQYCEKQELASE